MEQTSSFQAILIAPISEIKILAFCAKLTRVALAKQKMDISDVLTNTVVSMNIYVKQLEMWIGILLRNIMSLLD